MGDYIKAAQLNSSHIGKIVRVTLGKAEAQDVLSGVTLQTATIQHGQLTGPIGVTLKFQQLGEVECGHTQMVRVID